MRISPVLLELAKINTEDWISFREGQVLTAKVTQIKDGMISLILNGKIHIRSRAVEDLALREGQQVLMEVKTVSDSKIVLAVVEQDKGEDIGLKQLLVRAGMDATEENLAIAEAILENRMPVTRENVEQAVKMMKTVRFVEQNTDRLTWEGMEAEGDMGSKTLEEIARLILVRSPQSGIDRPTKEASAPEKQLATKEASAPEELLPKGAPISEGVLERERLSFIKQELGGVTQRDIVRLVKLAAKPTPLNLVLAKNIRENKGFFKTLLKALNENIHRCTKDGDPAVHRVETKNGMRPLSLSKLLQEAPSDSRARAATQMIFEKAFSLGRAAREGHYFVVPFIFAGEPEEAVVLFAERNKSTRASAEDNVEFRIITDTSFLGKIEAVVRKDGKMLGLRFLAGSEQAVRRILEEKEKLVDMLGQIGYKVTGFNCSRSTGEDKMVIENFFDVRV